MITAHSVAPSPSASGQNWTLLTPATAGAGPAGSSGTTPGKAMATQGEAGSLEWVATP